MGLIGVLDILSTVNTSGMKKGLKSAEGEVGGFISKIGGMGAAFTAVGAALAASQIVSGIKDAAFASTELIDSTTDAAARLGVTVESLTEMRYAAKYLGVESASLDSALSKFSVNLGNVDEEGGKTADALKRIGLDAKALSQLSPADALKEVAGAFDKLPDQASKSAAAMQIFGKGGVQILPFLSAGKGGIENLVTEAHKLGITFDDLAGAKIGDMKDGLDKLWDTLGGVSNELIIELAPAITAVAQAMLTLIKAAGGAKGIATSLIPLGVVFGGFGGGGAGGEADPAAKAKTAQDLASKRKAMAEAAMGVKVSDLTDDLKKQVETYGQSAEEIKLWELAQQGASKSTLAGATALVEQKKQLEANKKSMEELKSTSKSMLEAARTPLEKEQAEIAKVIEMRKKQVITEEQAAKLIRKIGDDSKKTVEQAVGAQLTPKEKFNQRKEELDKHLAEGTIGEAGHARGLDEAGKALDDAGKSLAGASLNPLEAYIKRRKELLKGLEEQTINPKQFNRAIGEAKKEFDGAVKGITGDTETPQEAYLKRMQELQKSLAEGVISQGQFEKAHGKSLDEFHGATGAKDPKFSGALQEGSAEARSQILKFTFGSSKDPFDSLQKTSQKQLDITAESMRVLQSIDKKLGQSSDLPDTDF